MAADAAAPVTVASTSASDAPIKGIACLALGVCVFVSQDVIIKSLSGGYPVQEMLWIRCVTGMPILLLLAWRAGPADFAATAGPSHPARFPPYLFVHALLHGPFDLAVGRSRDLVLFQPTHDHGPFGS
ncbi:MAG: hypothetical protein HN577_19985, partial [Rhodospirillaceae bacterium]|nr:hypothetical protein [Rhodospirillaceae bacterium]